MIEKIGLDRPGKLLRCKAPTRFFFKGKKIRLQPDDLVMFLGCWYFREPFALNERNRFAFHEKALRSEWNYPKEIAIVSFLWGEKILKFKVAGLSSQMRQDRKQNKFTYKRESVLYIAASWVYRHFEVATPERN